MHNAACVGKGRPMDYSYVVLIHLICAIFFVGALATEVFALGPIRRHLSEEEFQKVEFFLFRRIRRTYPVALIPLYGTGFWMYFEHVAAHGGLGELLSTRFGLLLTVKMVLALALFTIFASAPFLFMTRRSTSLRGWVKHLLVVTGGPREFLTGRFDAIHYVALSLGLAIVITAKLMFIL